MTPWPWDVQQTPTITSNGTGRDFYNYGPLRAGEQAMTAFQPGSPTYEAMIAERDELRAENERLRAALEEIASDPTGVSIYQAEIARRALEHKP